jgi:hypothetical protein
MWTTLRPLRSIDRTIDAMLEHLVQRRAMILTLGPADARSGSFLVFTGVLLTQHPVDARPNDPQLVAISVGLTPASSASQSWRLR